MKVVRTPLTFSYIATRRQIIYVDIYIENILTYQIKRDVYISCHMLTVWCNAITNNVVHLTAAQFHGDPILDECSTECVHMGVSA